MQLGVFIPIGNNGWLISTTSPQYKPSFELNKQTTLNAERIEHAQPVLPDIDAGAEDAQIVILLVDTDLPALAREGEASAQPGDAAAGNLDCADHVVLISAAPASRGFRREAAS